MISQSVFCRHVLEPRKPHGDIENVLLFILSMCTTQYTHTGIESGRQGSTAASLIWRLGRWALTVRLQVQTCPDSHGFTLDLERAAQWTAQT